MADVLVVAQVSGRNFGSKAKESDRLIHAGLIRAATGTGELYTDNNVTSITVGGGTALSGAAAVRVDAGAAGLTFDALSMVTPITLNEIGGLDLDANFTAGSIIGALNELKTGVTGGTPKSKKFTATLSQTVFDLGEAATSVRRMVVNGVEYTNNTGSGFSYYSVGTTTFANDTITWLDKLFTMVAGFEVVIWYTT